MRISEILKNFAYAILFGFIGLILGIWTADLLYQLIMKNMERVTTVYVSVIIVILITVATSLFGFIKGKALLE